MRQRMRPKKTLVVPSAFSRAYVLDMSCPNGSGATTLLGPPGGRRMSCTTAPHARPLRAKYIVPSLVTDGAYCWRRPGLPIIVVVPAAMSRMKTLQFRAHLDQTA